MVATIQIGNARGQWSEEFETSRGALTPEAQAIFDAINLIVGPQGDFGLKLRAFGKDEIALSGRTSVPNWKRINATLNALSIPESVRVSACEREEINGLVEISDGSYIDLASE